MGNPGRSGYASKQSSVIGLSRGKNAFKVLSG